MNAAIKNSLSDVEKRLLETAARESGVGADRLLDVAGQQEAIGLLPNWVKAVIDLRPIDWPRLRLEARLALLIAGFRLSEISEQTAD